MQFQKLVKGALTKPGTLSALGSRASIRALTVSFLIWLGIDCSCDVCFNTFNAGSDAAQFLLTSCGWTKPGCDPICPLGPEAPQKEADMGFLLAVEHDGKKEAVCGAAEVPDESQGIYWAWHHSRHGTRFGAILWMQATKADEFPEPWTARMQRKSSCHCLPIPTNRVASIQV